MPSEKKHALRTAVHGKVHAASCPSRKVCHESEASAEAVALATRSAIGVPMAYYRCDECSYWHTTKNTKGKRQLPPPRSRATSPEKIARTTQMLIEADALAIDALMTYPNGNVRAVLEACELAHAEAEGVRLDLAREGIEHAFRDSLARAFFDAKERLELKRKALARLVSDL